MCHSPRIIAAALALSTVACEDSSKPAQPDPERLQLQIAYVCDNDFILQSASSAPLTVEYHVLGGDEDGELLLPAREPDGTQSSTRLTTLTRGPLQVSTNGEDMAAVPNAAASCPPSTAVEPQSTVGEWTAPFPWPIVAVHLHLLPDGKVLSWGRVGSPQLWSPETTLFVEVPSATMLFCSGHAFLPDGRLLVTGGHLSDEHGIPDVNTFDPVAQRWTAQAPMSRGRWYPSSTTLPDGSVLTTAGRDEAGIVVDVPEIWSEGVWRPLEGAARSLPYYPRVFVAPNGLVFYAGELQQSAYLNPDGSGSWSPVARSQYGRRDYGSAVMYQPGKVMILGGSDPPDGLPTASAEVIDLSDPAPSWRYTGHMLNPRRQFNATILPDGKVLATGGTSAAGFSDPAGAVHAAEMWDPRSEEWQTLASNQVTRVYHSTTLLLPDGRVLHAGSGDGPNLPRELNAELFSPPYLFKGPRPTITGVPSVISYGQAFFVASPDAGRVVRATLVRLASVTHGFDQNQRFLDLTMRRTAGGISIIGPSASALAPPGHYVLFVLNSAGVPSPGSIIQIR
jgi:WD40 repeat protein